jgi:hypothetical protein
MKRPFSFPNTRILLTLAVAALLALGLFGCSDSTDIPEADSSGTGGALAVGNLDPGGESFVLQTLTMAPDELTRIPIQLIGSNLVVDGDSNHVSLDVAIRNQHSEPLFPPSQVSIYRFDPLHVYPMNPDGVIAPMSPGSSPIGEVEYYYYYSELLGEDGILSPGETSEARTWLFNDPDLLPFSFAARAEFGLEPALPSIAGICFWDQNANGIMDPEDLPMPDGLVVMTTPSGETTRTYCDPQGQYSFPVRESGLYSLTFDPMIDTLVPIFFTTPHPRQVLLTPDADGLPNSYLDAHFGMANVPHSRPEAIQFTDSPPDSLRRVHWNFIDAEIMPDLILRMHVGLSGCQPIQPTSLYMSGGFMESEPVQAHIVFVNESIEICGAYWETEYFFYLVPLHRAYEEAYGSGMLALNVIDFMGLVHRLEFPVNLPD